MSIINLEKTFENESLIYCNLNNKVIIECICLSELSKINTTYYNKKIGYFNCDKIKIIAVYDIYKNIIYEPIKVSILKKKIKIGRILKNLNKTKYYFFKTFLEAFLINNKLNNMNYTFGYKNILYSVKIFTIIDDNKINTYNFFFDNNYYGIYCYKDFISYTIFNDYIKITKLKYPLKQIILCNKKNLRIYEISEYYKNKITYIEERNNNNEITYWKEYKNKRKLKKFIIDNKNPPFSKPLKKLCIELSNHYNKNINNYIKEIIYIFKRIKNEHYNLLLNYDLEMINFK